MTVMIDTPAVGIVWHLMPCPSGYLIEWERPDGTWCYVNSEGSCLPPGAWVEWSELKIVEDEEVWYSAGNEGTPWRWHRRRWMEVGSEHLLRWVRSLGRLVPAGSDPDPTSRGPITGGGS